MKSIFEKVKGFCKTYKKRIITSISICLLVVVVATAVVTGIVYKTAESNLKYSQEDMEKIALVKVPGEVVDTEKELNFKEKVYEYEFKIKDQNNMLQTVTIDSKYGVIVNDKKSDRGGHKKSGEKSKENKANRENGED